MENYIIEILLTLIIIIMATWRLLPSFAKKYQDIGANMISNHIFNQVKNTGFINIILDGVQMTLVEKVQPKEGKTKKK